MEFPFLNDLNDSQREAVTYTGGPSLVIAGAGSGKTRVLTYKVAYLLHTGMHPASILALTFTNKAAREMKTRIGQMVGYDTARYLWMGTFHSIFARILRTEAERIGYTHRFTIYDTADSKSLVKAIVKEMQLDDKVYKPGVVLGRISSAKNSLVTPQAYAADSGLQQSDRLAKVPMMTEIYTTYCARCKQADAMDFDDLLLQTNLLFRDHPDVLQKYQSLFQYILVDEYQDTNFAQYLIVKKLAERHEKICVVGDDAQSIYSFRGANIDNILTFKNTYPSARLFKLEQNYRSTQTIVNAANSLIDKNSAQIRKTIFSQKEKGEPLKVTNLYTDLEEGTYVADTIRSLHRRPGYGYSEMAVLYRTNSQSRVLEEALRKQGLPYKIYGGLSFYQRKEIKDVVAYFRLITNPNDEESLKRVINYPARGIGDTTVGKLLDCAHTHGASAWDVLTDPLKYNLPVNAGTAAKLAKFRDLINTFAEQVDALNAYDMAQSVIKGTGILADTLLDRSPESLSKQDNVQELLKAIHEFCENKAAAGEDNAYLPDYLAEISLLTDQDTDQADDANRVTLMTVHAAKGLEFKVVFIVGMEEELFPSAFCMENERDLEEERRLFYVAITRAEERCFISYARQRFRNGKMNFSNPSRFLKDIDPQYLDCPQEDFHEPPRTIGSWDDDLDMERLRFGHGSFSPSGRQPAFVPPPAPPKRLTKLQPAGGNASPTPVAYDGLPVGAYVQHAIFGIGKVIETNVDNGNAKAVIDFGEKGKKTLLLKFAKLEVLK